MAARSARRSLGSMALAFESFVVFFATLAAFGLQVADGAMIWVIGLVLAIVMILTPGVLGRKGSYWFGWALQLTTLVLSILTITVHWVGYIFLVFSFIFIGLWGWAMLTGTTLDAANRAAAKLEELNKLGDN